MFVWNIVVVVVVAVAVFAVVTVVVAVAIANTAVDTAVAVAVVIKNCQFVDIGLFCKWISVIQRRLNRWINAPTA